MVVLILAGLIMLMVIWVTTGNLEASIIAVEIVDQMLGKLIKVCEQTDTILLVTADHGNCDQMFDAKEESYPDWKNLAFDKRPSPKTSHTLSQVPLYVLDPGAPRVLGSMITPVLV